MILLCRSWPPKFAVHEQFRQRRGPKDRHRLGKDAAICDGVDDSGSAIEPLEEIAQIAL
jgi:hypothetical protein